MQLTQAQTDIMTTAFIMKTIYRLGFDFEVSREMEDIFASTVVIRLTYPEEFM
jgi:hypothetical protein